ncbi:hypothetical protein ZWY2020_011108 [Hordeum vulgare]|nr:hypothetical protein ZWY2020_011108 [Hordeum vulgare]
MGEPTADGRERDWRAGTEVGSEGGGGGSLADLELALDGGWRIAPWLLPQDVTGRALETSRRGGIDWLRAELRARPRPAGKPRRLARHSRSRRQPTPRAPQQIGGVPGLALAATLFLGFGYLTLLFTDDPSVLDIAQSGVWFVTITQPINAIAFVFDGLYYGVSDFGYAAYSTLFAGVVSSAFLLVVPPSFGLGGVWAGLTLFMGLRAIAGFWR